jgi:hypothetical protein
LPEFPALAQVSLRRLKELGSDIGDVGIVPLQVIEQMPETKASHNL